MKSQPTKQLTISELNAYCRMRNASGSERGKCPCNGPAECTYFEFLKGLKKWRDITEPWMPSNES